jgi:hypothetical protein
MAEPSSTSAAAFTVGTVSIVGTFLGMHYDALLLGLFGGLIMLARQQAATRLIAFSSVTLSTLFAGAMSPVAASVVVAYTAALTLDEARISCAALIGCGWQSMAPIITDFVKQSFGAIGKKIGLGE